MSQNLLRLENLARVRARAGRIGLSDLARMSNRARERCEEGEVECVKKVTVGR